MTDSDINDARPELRFLLDTEKGLIPQILHIGPWTLDEAISRWAREAEKEAMQMGLMFSSGRAEFVRTCTLAIQPLLSMVLYLCSEEPELKDRNSPDHGVCLPKAKRTKKGWRLSFRLQNRGFGPLVSTRAIFFAGGATSKLSNAICGRIFDERIGMAIGRDPVMANENFRLSGFRLWLSDGRFMKKKSLLPDGQLKLIKSW